MAPLPERFLSIEVTLVKAGELDLYVVTCQLIDVFELGEDFRSKSDVVYARLQAAFEKGLFRWAFASPARTLCGR